jgi:hypothetical protein
MEIIGPANLQRHQLDPQRRGTGFHIAPLRSVARITGIHQETERARTWNHLDRERELFAR